MRSAWLLFAASGLAFGVQAASFDCAKAKTAVEIQICSDPLLGRLDAVMSANYLGMLSADVGASRQALRAEQREWLARRNQCATVQCLIERYRERVDDTCEYGVVSGVHPVCTMARDVK